MAKKTVSKSAGKRASQVVKDQRSGKDTKTAAGSALTQRPDKGRGKAKGGSGQSGTDDPGPSIRKKK